MEIQIKFNTWEEMQEFCRRQACCENAAETAEVVKEMQQKKAEPVKEEVKPDEMKKAEKKEAQAEKPVESPKVDEPEISLQDVQKAVRELVKAKGKETAKEVLGRHGATGASSVRAEDYKAVIAELKEALNA